MERTRYRIEVGRQGLEAIEDANGSWEYHADAQRALDAERERVKELEEWQRVVVGTGTDQEAVVRMAATEYTKIAVQCWKDENAKLTAQLATLQAQLADEQQRADRAAKDRSEVLDVKTKEGLSCSEWLMRTATAERKVKGLQAQLADRDAMILQMGEQAAVLAKENMAVKAQLRQVEGERDQWIAANTKEPINEPVTYQALAGARFVAKRAFDELVKARSELSALRQLVEALINTWVNGRKIHDGIPLTLRQQIDATLAAKDAGKEVPSA